MQSGIELDTRLWPVVLHRVKPVIDLTDMEIYNDQLSELLERGEPFASLVIVKGKGKLDRRALPAPAQAQIDADRA